MHMYFARATKAFRGVVVWTRFQVRYADARFSTGRKCSAKKRTKTFCRPLTKKKIDAFQRVSSCVQFDEIANMRVTFVHLDLGIGGAERLVVDCGLALQQAGHTVDFITSHHDESHCFPETESQLPVTVRAPSLNFAAWRAFGFKIYRDAAAA